MSGIGWTGQMSFAAKRFQFISSIPLGKNPRAAPARALLLIGRGLVPCPRQSRGCGTGLVFLGCKEFFRLTGPPEASAVSHSGAGNFSAATIEITHPESQS